jgi:hypothetical protein
VVGAVAQQVEDGAEPGVLVAVEQRRDEPGARARVGARDPDQRGLALEGEQRVLVGADEERLDVFVALEAVVEVGQVGRQRTCGAGAARADGAQTSQVWTGSPCADSRW